MPVDCSASDAPYTVICNPRGWLRLWYNEPGSKPVGNTPAEPTAETRDVGSIKSSGWEISTRTSRSCNVVTFQPGGITSGNWLAWVTNVSGAPSTTAACR